ncbi:unnamed protein product [Calypogeia fissa]
MTVMSLIRRYKRWNPVHPTYGAFWGLGVGLGCGVGWGPGFGPEAVGFVGSGCGVGFSVGVTLIGIGVGLPASGFTCLPWNAMIWTGKGASNATSNFILPTLVYIAQQSWEAISYQANEFDRGIQNLYRTQVPKSRQFILESRKRFLRKVQDARNRAVTGNDHVLQMQALDTDQKTECPPMAQTVSFPRPGRTGNPRDLPGASKDVQSQSSSEESKEK